MKKYYYALFLMICLLLVNYGLFSSGCGQIIDGTTTSTSTTSTITISTTTSTTSTITTPTTTTTIAGWQAQSSGTTKVLYDVCFVNSAEGVVVGESGTILFTRNGGQNWFPAYSGTTQELKSVEGANGGVVYAVGTGGVAIKTTTLSSWELCTSLPFALHNDINDVSVVSSQDVFVVGNYGKFSRTADGGNSWIAGDSPHCAVAFGSTLEGFTAGSSGVIFYSDNSGAGWGSVYNDGITEFSSINIVRHTAVYAVGFDGFIVKSIDGTTWLTMESGTSRNLNRVFFLSSVEGWAVGDQGTILFSNGTNWVSQESEIANSHLCGIHAVTGVAYAVGYDGVILKRVLP